MSAPLSQAEFEMRVKRLRWALLFVWGSVTFCVAFFARSLSELFSDRPVGFWLAAQGSVLIFLIITWVYALWVNAWERRTPTGNLPTSHHSEDSNQASPSK